MLGQGSAVFLTEVLWFLVLVGWIVLIMIGLEADKPLSGGLPGHVDFNEAHSEEHLTAADRFGSTAAMVLFTLTAFTLPVILYWIFTTHGQ
jgi:hypothetical protein